MVGTSTLPPPASELTAGGDDLEVRLGLLKAVADPTRLQVLDALAVHGPRCHCELEEDLEVPANRLSFHLKVLREVGLVLTVRCGRRVRYHLAPDALARIHRALPVGDAGPLPDACEILDDERRRS